MGATNTPKPPKSSSGTSGHLSNGFFLRCYTPFQNRSTKIRWMSPPTATSIHPSIHPSVRPSVRPRPSISPHSHRCGPPSLHLWATGSRPRQWSKSAVHTTWCSPVPGGLKHRRAERLRKVWKGSFPWKKGKSRTGRAVEARFRKSLENL